MNIESNSSKAIENQGKEEESCKIDNVNDGTLDFLKNLSEIYVQQEVELLELLTHFETENKYKIIDPNSGTEILAAKEETECCNRNCLGRCRSADIVITNPLGVEVLHLTRFLRMKSCCFPCCLQKMEVYYPPGNLIGNIKQKWSFCNPTLVIEDTKGNSLFKIVGPACGCGIVHFEIYSTRFPLIGKNVIEKIGEIRKMWGGYLKEAHTDADSFGIDFPDQSSVNEKCLLLGALFLIDYMYFETTPIKRRERYH